MDELNGRPCPQCGRINRGSAHFCHGCGAALVTMTAAAVDAPDGQAAAATSPLIEEAELEGLHWAPPPIETLLAGRFELLEELGETDGVQRYVAHDYALCPICHDGPLQPAVEYCDWCGARLAAAGPPPTVEIVLSTDRSLAATAESVFTTSDGRFVQIVRPAPDPVIDVSVDTMDLGLQLEVGYASDRGTVRAKNEDSLLVAMLAAQFDGRAEPTVGMFLAADGIGGGAVGELASRRATQVVAERLMQSILLPYLTDDGRPLAEAVRERMRDAFDAANTAVQALAQAQRADVACTLTAMLVIDGQAFIAHVGDCRVYVYSSARLRQVTTDHSLVAGLLAAGDIDAEQAAVHPDRHVLYRAIGHAPRVEVEQLEEGLRPGDAVILCTDGVWEPLGDAALGAALAGAATAQQAADAMTRQARDAGGADNASAIVVRLAAVRLPLAPDNGATMNDVQRDGYSATDRRKS